VPDAPPVLPTQAVTVHVWEVATSSIPWALSRQALERVALRRADGPSFAKLLGTGSGRTFTMRDADLHRWALLTVWDDDGRAAAFEHSPTVRAWDARAVGRLRLSLRPLRSWGQWSGREPFRPDGGIFDPPTYDGPVAVLTRARVRPRSWRAFAANVPPVATALDTAQGLRLRLAIGEAPIGLQATFSVWDDAAALTAFAYGDASHRSVITRTRQGDWYAEELFARFAVLSTDGDLTRPSGRS
jgi:hypothetical protein